MSVSFSPFFDFSLYAPPYLRYGVASSEGRVTHQTEIDLPGPSLLHDIAITSQGVPVIVWEQFASANSSRDIYASRFDPATFSWTAPEALTSTTMEEGHPKVSVDSNDVIHVVWDQSDAGLMEIVHRSFDGAAWSSPQTRSPIRSPPGTAASSRAS